MGRIRNVPGVRWNHVCIQQCVLSSRQSRQAPVAPMSKSLLFLFWLFNQLLWFQCIPFLTGILIPPMILSTISTIGLENWNTQDLSIMGLVVSWHHDFPLCCGDMLLKKTKVLVASTFPCIQPTHVSMAVSNASSSLCLSISFPSCSNKSHLQNLHHCS